MKVRYHVNVSEIDNIKSSSAFSAYETNKASYSEKIKEDAGKEPEKKAPANEKEDIKDSVTISQEAKELLEAEERDSKF